ncbi:MAG: sugar phosphate isomerase/epimerase [Phycisphaerae bacterium]|nr:sugar phosphate isomerase/epimerase [Phycisphaerae bacterium]
MAKPISLQLYSVREEAAKDFPGVLKRVAAMGYVGVEYAGLHGLSAKEVAKIVGDLGLKSSSAHVGLPTRQTIDQMAADAGALGYTHLIGGFGPDDMKTEDSVRACAAKLAEGADLAKSVGLKFGMHNHWWEFDRQFGGQTPYEIILSEAPNLFSELDIYWCCHGGADSIGVTRQWASRIPLLHIKDGDLTNPPVHKAVGEGKVPVRATVEAADPKVLEWLIVELDNCATDMMEAVAKSVRFLGESGIGRARK